MRHNLEAHIKTWYKTENSPNRFNKFVDGDFLIYSFVGVFKKHRTIERRFSVLMHLTPFKQTRPLQTDPAQLGPLRLWQVEWKWQGTPVRLRIQDSGVRITDRTGATIDSPEFSLEPLITLPEETTLEGVLPDGDPAGFVGWDCLEFIGADLTGMPLYSRQLQAFPMIGSLDSLCFRASEPLEVRSWEEVTRLLTSPAPPGVDGVVLKKTDSLYVSGEESSIWWTLSIKT